MTDRFFPMTYLGEKRYRPTFPLRATINRFLNHDIAYPFASKYIQIMDRYFFFPFFPSYKDSHHGHTWINHDVACRMKHARNRRKEMRMMDNYSSRGELRKKISLKGGKEGEGRVLTVGMDRTL